MRPVINESMKKEKETVNKEKHRKRQKLPMILATASVICVIIGAGLWFISHSGTGAYRQIRENAVKEAGKDVSEASGGTKDPDDRKPDEAAAAASTASAAKTSSGASEERPIDFQKLRETCPEAYAWIRIPNTNVDYPVCQRAEGDQTFYLDHRADGTPEFAGAIYSENYNARDFQDPVTVLYGHNMEDGSMFQTLHYYEDRAFFDKNRDVTVYLPDRALHYRVFAAYTTNDNHILLTHDCFQDEVIFKEYIQEILAQRSISGFVDQNTDLTEKSRILTLSTCNQYDDQRYLIQCVLVDPETQTGESR